MLRNTLESQIADIIQLLFRSASKVRVTIAVGSEKTKRFIGQIGDVNMPDLKSRMLFISHAWRYEADYNTVVSWLGGANNFVWKNCSVPSTDALEDKTQKGLEAGLTRQINPAQGVIIIAGMYAAHSNWIDYEINEALRLKKTIIGLEPWGHTRIPLIVSQNATRMVGWNSASLISAVRDLI
jgi:MTH538 TIR-like domain (DUF1863)